MLAENVDHARDPASEGVHGGDCVRLKDGLPVSACDAKPLANVAMRLFQGQRDSLAADSDALPKLTEIVALELISSSG